MTPVCTAASETPRALRAVRFGTRAQIIAGACTCAGFSAFLFAVDPSQHAVYPQCLFHQATGLYCAGCGATRALYALLHGRVLIALHDNALFILALPVLLYVTGRYALAAWRADAWPKVTLDTNALIRRGAVAFLVIFAFTIARNLPGQPFGLLRPH